MGCAGHACLSSSSSPPPNEWTGFKHIRQASVQSEFQSADEEVGDTGTLTWPHAGPQQWSPFVSMTHGISSQEPSRCKWRGDAHRTLPCDAPASSSCGTRLVRARFARSSWSHGYRAAHSQGWDYDALPCNGRGGGEDHPYDAVHEARDDGFGMRKRLATPALSRGLMRGRSNGALSSR